MVIHENSIYGAMSGKISNHLQLSHDFSQTLWVGGTKISLLSEFFPLGIVQRSVHAPPL